MSPDNPPFDPAKATEVVNANPDTSKDQPISASELAPESPRETPHVSEEAAQTVTTQENETLHISEEAVQSATAEENETGRVSEDKVQAATAQDDETFSAANEGGSLSELRSSLHTISNGVQGLANTVQDFFGLSDSSSSVSSDYDHDSDGRRKFSWAKFKSRARRRRAIRRRMAKGSQTTSSSEILASDDEHSKKRRVITPEIRECNLEQFQSRPAGDSHKVFCVDVLIAGDSLQKEVLDFKNTVGEIKAGVLESWKPHHVQDRREHLNSEESEKKWIRRIRINSHAVMELLRDVGPPSVNLDRPTVFYRPFQLLVSLQEDFKKKVDNLKRRPSASVDEGTKPKDSTGVASLTTTPTQDSDSPIQKLGETQNDLDELTCYVNFMETRIMPDARRYSDPSPSPSETIRHEDLWYLFKPGTLVYSTPDTSSPDRFRSSPYSHRILRVMQTRLTASSYMRPPIRVMYERPWSLLLHFIEHDGVSYAPAFFSYEQIVPFTGRKKVTELPIYPVSYLEGDQMFAQAQSDGATYVSLIERRSGFYSGWTQIPNSFGVPLTEFAPDSLPKSPEHIESDILVDFQETFNAFPGWKLAFYPDITGIESINYPSTQSVISDLPILEWDDVGRVKYDQLDWVVQLDATEVEEAIKFMKEDPLGQFKKETRSAPTGKYLALLPIRFFAYAVLQRKFVQLSTRFVRSADLEANDKAFEKLEINKDYKRLILALVKSHFDKVETEKKTNTEIETQDLIRGKGKGVVILLHGVPGVGKTATAEAVALKWKKPLFPITCGDLGYTADTLEKSLNEIFRLAHHWGCILLLDEADVFITQRERHDLKRNALVSGKCETCTLTF